MTININILISFLNILISIINIVIIIWNYKQSRRRAMIDSHFKDIKEHVIDPLLNFLNDKYLSANPTPSYGSVDALLSALRIYPNFEEILFEDVKESHYPEIMNYLELLIKNDSDTNKETAKKFYDFLKIIKYSKNLRIKKTCRYICCL